MEEQIINRVANSPLISIDLEEYYHPGERVVYDLKQNLFQELILREKDFRAFVKENDWSQYKDKNVAIVCTADAIVPTWAFMLIASKLQPHANMVTFGSLEELESALFREAISKINTEELKDRMVVVKGCSDLPVPVSAYVELTRKLRPIVKSIMFGEPCSTVPIYKKPK
ncbi:DUF2480 family protein [Flexithrix dorotheae]|uniref:DUF2480 family protein n=1 Tax=Flexithrix dorotheae TaxID=70993 RepID=UPI00035D4EAF|nr:DUF2480 family protein [Flexithrix dorotheae]